MRRILTYGTFFFLISCHGPSAANQNNLVPSGNNDSRPLNYNDNINFRSFQNSDNTWGFTIFVNSMPFRHYSKIPYRSSSTGFISREEAEKVATLFVGMILSGDTSPRLDRKSADSLNITLNKRKMPTS